MLDVSNLPFRDQFEAAVVVSGVCLVAAVVLREWFTDRDIRIIARVLGLAGWAVVVTFAWRMTETNETLATQLMVKGKQNATSIADPVRVVAVASEYETTTAEGVKVSVVKYSDGRVRPMLSAVGRSGRYGSSDAATSDSTGRTGTALGGSDRLGDSLRTAERGMSF